MRTLVWQRLDAPGMEVARVSDFTNAVGTQIGRDYELRWRLNDNHLELELNGGETVAFELGDADFFDLYASPFFNSLPVVRDGLLTEGDPRDYVMQFVRVPELSASPSEQRYTPRGRGVVGYAAGAVATDIEFDGEGFVIEYHGFFSRLS